MANEDKTRQDAETSNPPESLPGPDAQGALSSAQTQPQTAPPVVENRTELLERARGFLTSPQVVHEDLLAKRRFLAQKGLNDLEIEKLMQELPPILPPRTYPQPPPSNLPNLLSGALRIISWIAGGSAALILFYFRFIYPRLNRSFQARLALHNHQKGLLDRFTTSVRSLKATHDETFAVLPQPQPFKENPQFAICHTTDDIASLAEESHDIPAQSLLRCAIEELTSKKEKASGEAIFQLIETKFPWVQSQEEPVNEAQLWEFLSTSPVFEQQDADGISVWKYNPPAPPAPPPLATSLSSLLNVLPEKVETEAQSAFQKTLSTLTDFTGYIASQTYSIPYRFGNMGTLSPEEDELRREIRALKGLVLNRRSFLPPRPPVTVGQSTS